MSLLHLVEWKRREHRSAREQANHSSQRGFSLLEALVAMAIASIALGSLYRAVGQSSKGVADVEARVEAALVARSVLAGSTFAEDISRESSGNMGRWYWTVRAEPEQIRFQGEGGQALVGDVLRAAKVTVDVASVAGGPTVMTWTTWKPYRLAP